MFCGGRCGYGLIISHQVGGEGESVTACLERERPHFWRNVQGVALRDLWWCRLSQSGDVFFVHFFNTTVTSVPSLTARGSKKKITKRSKSFFQVLICEVIRNSKHKQVGTRGSLQFTTLSMSKADRLPSTAVSGDAPLISIACGAGYSTYAVQCHRAPSDPPHWEKWSPWAWKAVF
jgi:hypothetical protein